MRETIENVRPRAAMPVKRLARNRIAPLCACLGLMALSACAAGAIYDTPVGPLRVFYDDTNTFFTGPVMIDDEAIEPFPLPGSLVVVTPDGADLTYSFEAQDAAERAMQSYCEETTGSAVLSNFSFQNGRFAGLCAQPVGPPQ